jgi:hypothetical protein
VGEFAAPGRLAPWHMPCAFATCSKRESSPIAAGNTSQSKARSSGDIFSFCLIGAISYNLASGQKLFQWHI